MSQNVNTQAHPLSEDLEHQFQELTRYRESPQQTLTEQKFIPTEDGGYIHEVTSRTTPRRRPDSGEEISTVTQRRVSTSNVANFTQSSSSGLNLKYASKHVPTQDEITYKSNSRSSSAYSLGDSNNQNSRSIYPQQQQQQQQSSSSSYGGGNLQQGPQQQGQQQPTQQQVQYRRHNTPPPEPYGAGVMAYDPNHPHYQQQAAAAAAAAGGGGGGDFRAEPVYHQNLRSMAPDQYGKHTQHNNNMAASPSKNVGFGPVQTKIVDPYRISPLHINPKQYAPLKYVTKKELRALQRKRGMMAGQGFPERIRTSSCPRLDALAYGGGEYPDGEGTREFYDPSYHRSASQGSQHGGSRASSGSRAGGGISPILGGGGKRHTVSSNVSGGGSQPQRSTAMYIPANANPSINRYYPRIPNIDGQEMLDLFTDRLAQIRNIKNVVEPPAYAAAAMKLLVRGTHLVHYGAHPHERYFMLRLLPDEMGRQQPYLVWAQHEEAATFMDRVHLAHLRGVGRGPSTRRFRQHSIDAKTLRGPYVGDDHSLLPPTYAFSFVFQARTTSRTVEVLALDDQTFRCWLLVCDYFADVNSNHEVQVAGDEHDFEDYEAETLQPDTPRSSVAPSAHG